MRVLHLFSNAKYTGPAEPVLNLCVALRGAGVEADLAIPPLPATRTHTLLETSRERGIEPILRFRLSKHERPIQNWLNARALRAFLAEHPYDLVHCHLDNDHRVGLAAARPRGVPVIRSSYEGLGFHNPRRHAPLLKRTTFLIEPSKRALEHDHETYGFPIESMQVVSGAVDVMRFDPGRPLADARQRLGIPAGAFVVGIVARLQRHRRYEDFFKAIRVMLDADNTIHAIVIGRGTHQRSVGREPVRALGLERHIHFPGYMSGDAYVELLRAIDVKVFLVPGSDGTCRAVREAMAMGKPAVVADRGMLPEIVDDGVCGYVCGEGLVPLAEALSRLRRRRDIAEQMGRAARAKAVREFALEVQARHVMDIYECVLRGRRVPDPRVN
jgi:glycosyltransferase involved in cell wall biosynthesis